MIRQFFHANKTLAVLLGGNIFLLALLTAEWQFDAMSRAGFERDLQQNRKTVDTLPELPEFEIPLEGEEEYASIVEHPLFLEGREPVENTEESPQTLAAGGPPGGEMNMSLSGIAVLPDAVMALLADKAGKYYRVKKGESVQGWTVEEVMEDKVVLTNGTERREILLREFKNKKPPPPGSTPSQQAQPQNGPDPGRHGAHGSGRAPPIPPPIPNPGMGLPQNTDVPITDYENSDPGIEDQ